MKPSRARINKVLKEAASIIELAQNLKKRMDGEKMQELRDSAESLLQCVHEFNAYQNVGE